MKTGKKAGRWKYAVPVLILVLILALLGLLWNNVNNTSNSTDEIYLYGERHGEQWILNRELEIWGEYYKKGMRDLFVEYSYADAQFLNLWMQADEDELLEQQIKDWEGSTAGTEVKKNFLKQIKKNYPKTVFHGTDVDHTWMSTGPRYLKYLRANGQQDTEEYKRAQENIVQGRQYYKLLETDKEAAERYREDRMVENFQRSYQELEEVHHTDIMGIYGRSQRGRTSRHPATIPIILLTANSLRSKVLRRKRRKTKKPSNAISVPGRSAELVWRWQRGLCADSRRIPFGLSRRSRSGWRK